VHPYKLEGRTRGFYELAFKGTFPNLATWGIKLVANIKKKAKLT